MRDPKQTNPPLPAEADADAPTAAYHTRGAKPDHGEVPPELAQHPDYRILGELGRGGMGVVYAAMNRTMNRREVLKIVNPRLLRNPEALERFKREIQAAAGLSHPNIVIAYSAPRIGDLLVFAMEYVPGIDLAKAVQRHGALPISHSTYYAYQAALGLQHAHDKQVVHRDIKPSNLLLARHDGKYVVKILDFGLATAAREKSADDAIGTTEVVGTPAYMSPEQARGDATIDARSDVYSLGCTLYCLLAGKAPFRGDTVELLRAHQSERAEPLSRLRDEVPEELSAIVQRMMAKRPEDRFQSAKEAAKALEPYFRTAPAAVAPATSLPAAVAVPRAIGLNFEAPQAATWAPPSGPTMRMPTPSMLPTIRTKPARNVSGFGLGAATITGATLAILTITFAVVYRIARIDQQVESLPASVAAAPLVIPPAAPSGTTIEIPSDDKPRPSATTIASVALPKPLIRPIASPSSTRSGPAAVDAASIGAATTKRPLEAYVSAAGLPKPWAHFLFNGSGGDEVSDDTQATFKNCEFRAGALFVNGRNRNDGSGLSSTANLVTRPINRKAFTLAMRYRAESFDPKSHVLLGVSEWSPPLVVGERAPGQAMIEFGKARTRSWPAEAFPANAWKVLVCGVDLNAGLYRVAVDGTKPVDIEVPQRSATEADGTLDKNTTWQFANVEYERSFHGLIDEFIIYDRLLTPEEFARVPLRPESSSSSISRHPPAAASIDFAAVQVGRPVGPPPAARLVARFPFEGNVRNELDSSSRSFTGPRVKFENGAFDTVASGVSLNVGRFDPRRFTVSLRLRARGLGKSPWKIVDFDHGEAFELYQNGTSGRLVVALARREFRHEIAGLTFDPPGWYSLRCAIDREQGRGVVHLDGSVIDRFEIPRNLTAARRASSGAAISLGGLNSGFDGLIDELAVYDGLVADDQVAGTVDRATAPRTAALPSAPPAAAPNVPAVRGTRLAEVAVVPFNPVQAAEIQQLWSDKLGVPTTEANSLGIPMVLLPPGGFRMGSSAAEIASAAAEAAKKSRNPANAPKFSEEGPQHPVVLSRPILMASRPVNLGEFRRFAEAVGFLTKAERDDGIQTYESAELREQRKPTDGWRSRKRDPSEDLSTIDPADFFEFCNWLSKQEGLPPCYERRAGGVWQTNFNADGYRLPTEAEWEFACRGGQEGRLECRMLPGNAFGLIAIGKTPGEMCNDSVSGANFYSVAPVVDPVGHERKNSSCTLAARGGTTSGRSGYSSGFGCARIVRRLPGQLDGATVQRVLAQLGRP